MSVHTHTHGERERETQSEISSKEGNGLLLPSDMFLPTIRMIAGDGEEEAVTGMGSSVETETTQQPNLPQHTPHTTPTDKQDTQACHVQPGTMGRHKIVKTKQKKSYAHLSAHRVRGLETPRPPALFTEGRKERK